MLPLEPDTAPEEPRTPQEESDNNPVIAFGTNQMPNENRSPIHCITIIGQVEGHMVLPPHNKTTKYEHIMPMLIAIEESPDIKGFIVLLNTVGGDVEAGLALAEMIAGMSKPSVSIVLGGGHSIGVPLAVSTDYSYIAPTATMTIHPIRMTGLVIGVPQTYDYLNKMQQRVVTFITSHTQIDEQTLNSMMMRTGEMANDIGTILVGKEAVDCGLIDDIGTISAAMNKLKALIAQKEQA